MKKLFAFSFFLSAVSAHAQVVVSDITNDGSQVHDFANQETVVTAPLSGIGYQARNGGGFFHYGPASGTLIVNGSYDAFNATPANPGIDHFTGLNNLQSTSQQIDGNTAPIFGILNLNNGLASQINITNSNGAIVGKTVNFSNGITTTARANSSTGALRLLNDATYTSTAPGDSQFVNGYVGKIGDDAFIFPVGDQNNSDLRTLAISAPGTATDHLSIAYWQGDAGTALDPTGGAHSRISLNPAGTPGTTQLASVSSIGFWDWVPVSGTSSLTITISIPDFSGPGGYSSPADMRVVGWNINTNQWDNLSGSTGPVTNTEGTIMTGTVTDMSSYSAIGVGAIYSAPLPITLLSFKVEKKGSDALLTWTTAAEQGSGYFEIEHSTDAQQSVFIGKVAATGNTGMEHQYSYTNVKPGTGTHYYRLKLVDKKGSYEYSPTRNVTFNSSPIVALYPNPVGEQIIITGAEAGSIIQILNAAGKLVAIQTVTSAPVRIDIHMFASAQYVVQILKGGATKATLRFVKE